jgi:hypothetical protein
MTQQKVLSCDLHVRNMLVNITKKQNEMLIRFLSTKLNLDEDYMIEKYLIPLYYMPIIEKRSITL